MHGQNHLKIITCFRRLYFPFVPPKIFKLTLIIAIYFKTEIYLNFIICTYKKSSFL